MSPNAPIIAYAHMGKVGGKRLLMYLRSHFGIGHLDVSHTRNGATYTAAELRRDLHINPFLCSIGGHNVKPHEDFTAVKRPLRWYTILRQPIQRMLCQYAQQIILGYTALSLREWLDRYRRTNWQVKMLAGEVDLNKALDTLAEKFVAVGLNARYEESLLLIADRLGLEGFRFNDGRGAAPPETPELWADIQQQADGMTDRLHELLKEEIELYRIAKARFFEEQVTEYGRERLARDLDRHFAACKPVGKWNWRNIASKAWGRLLHQPVGWWQERGARRRQRRASG